jgi:transcriptional regulator with XRE-family HTH domain
MTKIAKKIKDLRQLLKLTQSELGVKVGVPQATVSKWENGKQEPDSENNVKLASFAGVEIHEWLDMPQLGQSTVRTRRVPLVGVLQAGAFREAVEYPVDDQRQIEAPIPAVIEGVPTRNLELQAFEVAGPSMNRYYPDGTVVYAASVMSFRAPEHEDRVIVVRRNKSGLVEVTLKEYVVAEDGRKWLYPRSYDPEFQAPLQYRDGSDGDEIHVTGIVVAALVVESSRKRR